MCVCESKRSSVCVCMCESVSAHMTCVHVRVFMCAAHRIWNDERGAVVLSVWQRGHALVQGGGVVEG